MIVLSRLSSLLLLAPLAFGCTDAPSESGTAESALGVRLFFAETAACASLPPGTLPPEVTLVELDLTAAGAGTVLQHSGLLVNPKARCRDDQAREFSCPFDEDGDGLRERYFALRELPVGTSVQLSVLLKNELSNPVWGGKSAPIEVAGDAATVISVMLHPLGAECAGQ